MCEGVECVRGGENVIEGKEMFLKKRKEMVKGWGGWVRKRANPISFSVFGTQSISRITWM